MKKIKTLLYGAAWTMAAALTLTGCSTADLVDGGSTSISSAQINVSNFPAFSAESTTPQTRTAAVGTYDAGKSAWVANDQILLKVTDGNNKISTATATFDGTAWTLSPALTSSTTTASVEAYYAPNYKWDSNNTLTLKSEKTAGTDEMLSYQSATAVDVTSKSGIGITFAARDYSRLRIAATPSTVVKLTCADFTANDGTTTAASGFTTTADANGNAYFYGTWTANATMAIAFNYSSTDYNLGSKKATDASTTGTSYALNALALPTTYNQVGAGTSSDNPYRIYNATQLQNIGVCQGQYVSLENDIDCSSIVPFSPIPTSDTSFQGTFDGKGYTISNLSLGIYGIYNGYDYDYPYSGLFYLSQATIKNVILKNPETNQQSLNDFANSKKASLTSAALAASADQSIIYNCGVIETENKHSITGTTSGALLGVCHSSYVISCFSNIPVNGSDVGGSLIGSVETWGDSNEGLLVASYSLGKVTSGTGTDTFTGGLVSTNSADMILSCYSTADVSQPNGTKGGLVGRNYFSIYYCATNSQLGTAGAGGTNGATYTGIGTNSGTATGCFGGITDFGDIRSKIVTADAEAQWTTYKAAHTNLPTEISSKSLDQLWGTATATGLKLSWEK